MIQIAYRFERVGLSTVKNNKENSFVKSNVRSLKNNDKVTYTE